MRSLCTDLYALFFGDAPAGTQYHSKNFNVEFTFERNDVTLSSYGWIEFDQEASCDSCSPNDIFVTVNPGYLQVGIPTTIQLPPV